MVSTPRSPAAGLVSQNLGFAPPAVADDEERRRKKLLDQRGSMVSGLFGLPQA